MNNLINPHFAHVAIYGTNFDLAVKLGLQVRHTDVVSSSEHFGEGEFSDRGCFRVVFLAVVGLPSHSDCVIANILLDPGWEQ